MYPLRLQSRGFRHSPQANEETVIERQSGHKARTKAKEQTPHLALGAVGRSNACSRSHACGHLYLQELTSTAEDLARTWRDLVQLFWLIMPDRQP